MRLSSTIFLVLFALSIQAQISAPNFHVTDAHGVEHSLYEDYLDKGKTVVIDLFYVDCGPCNTIAPMLELTYRQWGQGNEDVQFMSLSLAASDSNDKIKEYEEEHNLSFPAAGPEGGSLEAVEPFTSGLFGTFSGAPTILIIAPNKKVTFDVWSTESWQAFLDELNLEIENAVNSSLSNIEDGIDNISTFNVFPNPASNNTTVDFSLNTASQVKISLLNSLGQLQSVLLNENLSAGTHTKALSIQSLAAGVNWIKVESDEQSQMIQLVKR